ncbi:MULTISPECIES: hypothetical protein [unclassified Paenibacillus]|uniref:hypothetical protein n=1 Tax=unclassified Paenibacillus TaxID=185978 RepID=UPI00115F8139|nr:MULTISPECIES: hypothetical protein [unclassified Paenibacillus]
MKWTMAYAVGSSLLTLRRRRQNYAWTRLRLSKLAGEKGRGPVSAGVLRIIGFTSMRKTDS